MTKDKAFRNSHYLEWVKTQRCVVSGEEAEVAHHIRLGDNTSGMGIKPSDYRVIPLTNYYHTVSEFSVHRMGEKSFQSRFGLQLDSLLIALANRYLQEVVGIKVDFLVEVGVKEQLLELESTIERNKMVPDRQKEHRVARNKQVNRRKLEQRVELKRLNEQKHQKELARAREYQKELRQRCKPDKNDSYHLEMRQKAKEWRRERYLKQKEYFRTLS